jgi:hypothetical protein
MKKLLLTATARSGSLQPHHGTARSHHQRGPVCRRKDSLSVPLPDPPGDWSAPMKWASRRISESAVPSDIPDTAKISTPVSSAGKWSYTNILILGTGSYHMDLLKDENLDTWGSLHVGYNVATVSWEFTNNAFNLAEPAAASAGGFRRRSFRQCTLQTCRTVVPERQRRITVSASSTSVLTINYNAARCPVQRGFGTMIYTDTFTVEQRGTSDRTFVGRSGQEHAHFEFIASFFIWGGGTRSMNS